ncbi:E3 ubiquitin-protein ligase [Trichinella pseudospiralis]
MIGILIALKKNEDADETKQSGKQKIKSRKNLCLLSVLNSYHSRTCLPENVCKFLFHRYVYSYLALVSIVAGVRYAL